jgi:hypothetical protein
MEGKTITLFMWGFQASFRASLEWNLQKSLEAIGVPTDPTVLLIGLKVEGGSDTSHPLCVEPEDGLIVPADFDGLEKRATELYDQDPDRQIVFAPSVTWIDERRHKEARYRAYGAAIREVLEPRLGLRFFVGLPVPVGDHLVFTALGLPEWVLEDTRHLVSEMASAIRLTRSLVQGVIEKILRLSNQALYQPYAGANGAIDTDPADIAKAAGTFLTSSAVLLAGNEGSDLFNGLNRLVTTRYERRVGIGSLLLAAKNSEYIERSLTFREPVHTTETRTLRKLLEISSRDGESLLIDGRNAYGLGRLRKDYPAAEESVFKVLVTGDGTWELHHADVALAVVQYGVPRLPKHQLERDRLDDICRRVFRDYDSVALWELAEEAKKAEHGTMLVISEGADAEATRLERQAMPVQPIKLANNFVQQVTGIDGAVLVDPSGHCHAIGVILDGIASSEGDRARGARYNSALKYLASAEIPPTVILLVSEDGMINLLPDLRLRIRRADLGAMFGELREAAKLQPVNGERFYKAYRRVQANAFYLTQEQCDEANALMQDHWQRRIADGGNIRSVESPLRPDPKMTDEYFID